MKTVLALLTALLLVPLGSLCAADAPFLAAGPPPQQESPLRDKTLVAWVTPATLTQRGGSVLTVIDNQERFDAIVFGERVAGKWMAGNDFFRRTPATSRPTRRKRPMRTPWCRLRSPDYEMDKNFLLNFSGQARCEVELSEPAAEGCYLLSAKAY